MEEIEELKQAEAALARDVATLEAINLEMSWISHRRMEQDLAAFNLTAPQYMTLRSIQNRMAGCTMSELAASSLAVSATMTGIVDRLVDRGLVTRARDAQDRRALVVELTPAGKDLLEQVNAHKRESTARLLSSISQDERAMVIDGARRYLKALEASLKL